VHEAGGLEAVVGDFVVILVASVLVLFASHKLRLSSVVGLLLTGMLIGPSGLRLIQRESVGTYAELGVVLLLFTIGLEVSLVRLRQNWRPFLLGGGAQVLLTFAAAVGIAIAFDVPVNSAIFLGFLASLSSTAIVLKTYTDRRELQSPQGMLSAGILLFQDFCLAPMIFLVPVLAGTADTSAGTIAGRVASGLLVVGVAFVIARTIMPRLLDWVVGTRTREIFILAALAICLAMALITSKLGFSLALGAFLAGLIISESEYSHQVVAEILPLRDVFNSIFFISVGMLLDLSQVAESGALMVGLGLALVAAKAAIVTVVAIWLGYARRVALVAGLSLAQIGEFSLVLAGLGQEVELLAPSVFQVCLGAAILTMLVTPTLISLAPRMAERAARVPLRRRWRQRDVRAGGGEAAEPPLKGHVIVVGYGVNGSNLSRVLSSTGVPFVVLELNGASVREGRKLGHPVVFGDAVRSEILLGHGIADASVLVVGIADQAAARRVVRVARDLNPSLHILARTRVVSEVEELRKLGADQVIPEEFETSVELFSRVLERYHVPRNVIRTQRQLIRDEAYGLLRRAPRESRPTSERVTEILEAALTETFLVIAGSPAEGRTLGGLDLRRQSGGASVIAVVRDGQAETSPSPDLELRANDNLVLVGDHSALEAAATILQGAREEPTDPASPTREDPLE
jgi:CPA2 family monovalent cation:H+ antiporter-2